jgi:voltage-gated potassium channel
VKHLELRRFIWASLVFFGILAAGTIGFRLLISDETWMQAFYRSVVSTTLTGLDTAPPDDASMFFTILLLFAGVAVFLYLAGVIVDVMTRGVLSETLGERRRKRAIDDLRDHVIICGYGRVGRRVAEEFRATRTPYVVVDVTPESIALAREEGGPVVLGDGTEDHDLEHAGLVRARGLVASVDSDEKNLYITLSARAQRPDLVIVARASNEAAARKIRLAGADRVIEPYSTAGLHMANSVVKPQVADFLDIVSTVGEPMSDLRFEEIVVRRDCTPCGHSIGDLRIQERTGAMVIALRKADGGFDATPGPHAIFEEGDVLIGVGTSEEIARLETLFAPGEAAVG